MHQHAPTSTYFPSTILKDPDSGHSFPLFSKNFFVNDACAFANDELYCSRARCRCHMSLASNNTLDLLSHSIKRNSRRSVSNYKSTDLRLFSSNTSPFAKDHVVQAVLNQLHHVKLVVTAYHQLMTHELGMSTMNPSPKMHQAVPICAERDVGIVEHKTP